MLYGGRRALQGLSFELRPGRVMGFLGPNGAGKTTSIRILTTILRPTSGHFTVDGISSDHPAEIRPRIGVLPETLGLPNQITGSNTSAISAGCTGGGAPMRGSTVSTCSSWWGCEIGRGISSAPTATGCGSDLASLAPSSMTLWSSSSTSQHWVWITWSAGAAHAVARDHARDRGAAIILCSHALAEVENVCDDVVILMSGRVVATGSFARSPRPGTSGEPTAKVRSSTPTGVIRREGHPTVEASPECGTDQRGERRGSASRDLVAGTDLPAAEADEVTNEVLDTLVRDGIPVSGFEVEGGHLGRVHAPDG